MKISFKQHGRLLAGYLRPQWPRVLLLAALILGHIGLQLVNPQIVRTFIDTAQAGGALGKLTGAALLFLGVAVAGQAVSLAVAYLGQNVAWTATNALRLDLTLHCLRLDMPFHKAHAPGELIERIDGDVTELANFFSQLVIRLLGNGLLVLGVVLLLFREDWRVGLVAAMYILLAVAFLRRVQTLASQAWSDSRQAHAELMGFLGERLAGTEDIRANGAEPYVMRQLHQLMRVLLQRGRRAPLMGSLTFILGYSAFMLVVITTLGMGAVLFLRGLVTIGTVYLLLSYVNKLYEPLQEVQRQIAGLQRSAASVGRVSELLQARPRVVESVRAVLPPGPLGVAFEGVSFHYDDGGAGGDAPGTGATSFAAGTGAASNGGDAPGTRAASFVPGTGAASFATGTGAASDGEDAPGTGAASFAAGTRAASDGRDAPGTGAASFAPGTGAASFAPGTGAASDGGDAPGTGAASFALRTGVASLGADSILDDVSFSLAPGQVLGLLGRTGSGKTTLTRLLFRLYDPTSGAITLGGADIRGVGLSDLRRRVGMVTQDVQLFKASVRDNLTFFNQRVPDEQILAVLKELGLWAWYESLAEGLDTVLEAGGKDLSAGEAQLLAFARVFLKEPGLVILDEASSRLDPATERLLERAVDRLLQGRTAIIVAHRLTTVQRADEILVLEHGRVHEHGDRQALAADPTSRFHSLLQTGLGEAAV